MKRKQNHIHAALLIGIFLLAGMASKAMADDILQAMPRAAVIQSESITRLLEEHIHGTVRGEETMQGWRVQVFSSNDQINAKGQAEALKIRLDDLLTEPVYIESMQPFWKVRIGNFRTQQDALDYRTQLVQDFPELQPEAYPVKDQIIVKVDAQ